MAKYNDEDWVGADSFMALKLPEGVREKAARMANAGVSDSTKAQYKSAWNLAMKAEKHYGEQFSMPWSVGTTIAFIVFARHYHEPQLKATTIKAYLAGIRMQHLMRGIMEVSLKPDIIKIMLTGAENLDAVKARLEKKEARQPVTWDLMKTIRQRLAELRGSKEWKTAVWLTCTLAFAGSFRIHEVLAKHKMSFSSAKDLLGKSVERRFTMVEGKRKEFLEVYLAHPKKARLSKGIKVDVFAIEGEESWACPVRAFRAYISTGCQGSAEQPLVQCANGTNYTGAEFNADLKLLLAGRVDYSKGAITSHSFRAGLATWMARAGFSDEEIMLTGRWKSQAFLRYIKTARTTRAIQAADLVARLARVVVE